MLKDRIESVDILRGLTIAAMILVNTPGTWSAVYAPLLHADWHGWTPTDLVFPFFLYIVGCSIAFSYRNRKPSGAVYRKITVRALKLIGLGLFLGAFTVTFPFFKDFADIRFPGVLQRIGLVFFLAALVALHANWKVILGVIATLLLGYWAWMGFIPLPDGADPTYERAANNWAMYIDKAVLGSHTWKPDYDPEGLLSTLPSIATALIGVLIGRLLAGDNPNKVIYLIAVGPLMLLLGLVWSTAFPINKALWTSSFVLVTAGVATMLLTLIYALTDVQKIRFGALFKRVGANALILYFLSSFITKLFYSIKVGEGTSIHGWLFQTIYVQEFLPLKLSSLLYALSVVAFYLWLGNLLYKRGVFFKV
ncbi:MAG: heparan-alpha-glucosaminide N-acetyltransferase domain-containing protein [Bacteroidota bacterium]